MQNAIELDINNKKITKESYIGESFRKSHTRFELGLKRKSEGILKSLYILIKIILWSKICEL